MQYRKDKYGNDISALGYGCMRFTKKGNSADLDKAEKEVMAAIEAGVNYFDTAYVYAGNEVAVGEILHRNHCREKINLATKLPHYLIKSIDSVEKMFQEELRRLQTDYIDYYLMHMLTDIPTWEKLKKLGMEEWIREKKASGQIRQIGFSYHGNSAMFCQLVDAYDWDFCQIQYNYMDRDVQAGDRGYALAEKMGVPMIVMEPVKGGTLANLPKEAEDVFRAADPDATCASWALRWVGSRPNVKVILSGMSSPEQVEDNLRSFSPFVPLDEEEEQVVSQAAQAIRSRIKNSCTACRYCMPCPAGVDIPGNFAIWNEGSMYDIEEKARKAFREKQEAGAGAQACIKCGKCESVCPQGIHIRKDLETLAGELGMDRVKEEAPKEVDPCLKIR